MHTLQNGVARLALFNHAASTLRLVASMVTDPSLTENFHAEVVEFQAVEVTIALERMRSSPTGSTAARCHQQDLGGMISYRNTP